MSKLNRKPYRLRVVLVLSLVVVLNAAGIGYVSANQAKPAGQSPKSRSSGDTSTSKAGQPNSGTGATSRGGQPDSGTEATSRGAQANSAVDDLLKSVARLERQLGDLRDELNNASPQVASLGLEFWVVLGIIAALVIAGFVITINLLKTTRNETWRYLQCLDSDMKELKSSIGNLTPERQLSVLSTVQGELQRLRESASRLEERLELVQTELKTAKLAAGAASYRQEPLVAHSVSFDRFATDHRAQPVTANHNVPNLVADYCEERVDEHALLKMARTWGIRWGSATPVSAQKRVSVEFNTSDNRILAFETAPGSQEFLLVLKPSAAWSLDLAFVFGSAGADGGPVATRGSARTRKPAKARGQAVGNELTVEELGSVDVSA